MKALLLALIASIFGQGAPMPVLDISHVWTPPGMVISVPMEFTSNGVHVDAIITHIYYDNDNVSYEGIERGALPDDWVMADDTRFDDHVTVLLYSFTSPATPLPDGVIFDLVFDVPQESTGSHLDLISTSFGGNGVSVTGRIDDGSINVMRSVFMPLIGGD